MSSVTSEQIIAAGPDHDSSDTDFFNTSLSIWRGTKAAVEDSEKPVPLDLHTACSIGSYDMVRMYINSEADLNTKNSGGYTPLMYASYIGHDNIVNLLLEAQADVNIANNKGLTSLMLAASCGNESVCFFLKDAGANLEARDKKSWTALFHATFNGHQNCVKFLLESGANIDAVETKYGLTPLMQAAYQGHEIIVQCLLQQGANRLLTSRTGETAQSLALKKGHMKIVTLLESSNRTSSNFHHRPGSPYHSSDGESSDNNTGTVRAKSLHKHYNIHEGPQKMSKMMSPGNRSNVTFKEPSKKPSKQVTENTAAVISQSPPSTGALHHQGPAAVPPSKVIPVAPTLKQAPVADNRPKDVHELLEGLDLLKYEDIFIKQDIDLEVFYTLSNDDLKEIGITAFGPRRKMNIAIESWRKDNPLKAAESNADASQLQYELKEKTWQLNQAYSQLAGYQSSIAHYHKELEHEKNIRSVTESYLLTEKAKSSEVLKQCKETRAQCSKALKTHGKVKNICQLLRARSEEGAAVGTLPQQLQESLSITDQATKTQIAALSQLPSTELWDGLQQGLREASASTAMVIFNLDKLVNNANEEF